MVKYFFQHMPVLARIFILAAVTLFIPACLGFNGGDEANVATPPAIVAPAEGTKILLGGPVHIQSGQYGSDASRVELWVKKPSAPAEQLMRSDIPQGGGLLQEWRPIEIGSHTIRIKTFRADNSLVVEQVRNYEVIPDAVVSLTAPPAAPAQMSAQLQPTAVPPTPVVSGQGSGEFQTAEDATIVIVATSIPAPTATPIPRYPPPPPAPGVPPGPVQSPVLNVGPPVCDAADYLGAFASDKRLRSVIDEADDIAPKVVGGTTVFRAWRLRNVGTCTWGTGYELAFYGGRSMGSGGVAFESTFPTDPVRRNALIDRGRLIVPEGKPNQTAILELALVAPVTPGIHQSYWRMRNPHGVFFGPILGVTMNVVRECEPNIYGAPLINKFEILGYGNVYLPETPTADRTKIKVEVGKNVTLDYQVNNATNFDIVFTDPTGETEAVSTSETGGRYSFPAKRLGVHTITLYADNGSCTIVQSVEVNVIPRQGEEFELDILLAAGAPVTPVENASLSAAVTPGTLQAQWQHYDEEVNEIFFNADLYQRQRGERNCLVPGWEWTCGQSTGEWKLVRRNSSGQVGNDADGAAVVCGSSDRCNQLSREIPGAQAGAAQAQEPISAAEHLTSVFCPADATLNPNVEYGVNYYVEARINGQAASPSESNKAFVICAVAADDTDFTNDDISETPPSCTLNQLGGITLPFACSDVPIVAGVSLVLLLVVFWIFFK
ncbi:MAG: hypothetical protein HC875_33190 [Anaerolineales bacterium]|nr:hypothetical protein [Anaerolineales bacterium]